MTDVLPRPKTLVVDDVSANLIVFRHLLSKLDTQVVEARNGHEALAACEQHEFALILLDMMMPDLDGIQVVQELGRRGRCRDTPIIFVTASGYNESTLFQAYGVGAVDYLSKPVNDTILLSKARVFLELFRARLLLAERNRRLEMEIAERERLQSLAQHQATHDPLTDLPNRLLLLDRLQGALERARRRQSNCGMYFIDLDEFKPVNDRYGHAAGDELLKVVSARMIQGTRKTDTVARLGGDEFAVVLEEPLSLSDAVSRAQSLIDSIREPIVLSMPGHDGSVTVRVGASVGVALYPEHATTLDELVRGADDAMYTAKRLGRNRCQIAGLAA